MQRKSEDILMFDNHKNEFKYPEKIFHEYKRAPTDESIKLAKEYEEKIHHQIAQKLMVKDNNINFSCALSNNELLIQRLYLKIKINDIEHSEVYTLDFIDNDKIIDIIRNWICNILTLNMSREFFYSYQTSNFGYLKVGENV
jgi:hypothetical protein